MKLFSLRWKLLIFMILSCIITALFLFLSYTLSEVLISWPLFKPFLAFFINNFGSEVMLFVIGTMTFLITYAFLTKPTMNNFTILKQSLEHLPEVNSNKLEVLKTNDEYGLISRKVNRSTTEISSYLDEIMIALNDISEGKIQTKIKVHDGHKLGQLAHAINEMAEKLEQSIAEERRAEQSKNDLVTGVSHDLRTPLTSVLGFLEVIIQGRYVDEVELMYYIDIAHQKSLQLKQLIDDLFEYTRMNNGLPIRKEKLALNDFIEQVLDSYIPLMNDVHLQGRFLASQGRFIIAADGELLLRSFENIIINAMKYGKDGHYIDIKLEREGDYAAVSIINYGEPIPSNEIPYIFDRFYRVDKSRNISTGGTGLGLAITKSIIELHDGEIKVYSDLERTCFKLLLPLVQGSTEK